MTLETMERALGYRFARRELLTQALTHRSYGTPNNERLELLGDSVLNCSIAASLYRGFPDLKEGELHLLRASMVRQQTLAEVALGLDIGRHMRFGDKELKSRVDHRPAILADALEAILGAVFLDAGFDAADKVIELLYRPLLSRIDVSATGKDAKTELQEYLHGRRLGLPRYELRATRGEAHAQLFDVDCLIPDLNISTSGSGASRRAAEQDAALRALEMARQK